MSVRFLTIVSFSRDLILRKVPSVFAICKSLFQITSARIFDRDLNKLAIIFGTGKFSTHGYTPHYEKHFANVRKQKLNILEIGIGGYEDVDNGGNSLRMWKHYFPKSNIYGLDIIDKTSLAERRITILQGDQSCKTTINQILDSLDPLDIVVDDGSHINKHVISSFMTIFPRVRDNGLYAIEDTHTSYLEKYGGDCKELNNPNTTMGFFKRLVDCVNSESTELIDPDLIQLGKTISSIHFYEKLIIVQKSS